MPEPLLNILKLCALALLYLFFLRVLRAVWAELRPPKPVPTPPVGRAKRSGGGGNPRRRDGGSARLVVMEPKDRRGQEYQLDEEITVGRAAGCQVSLQDNYVSQLHARVFSRDGSVYVEDLGSTNGTYLNTGRVTAATAMKRGDRLKIGTTVMELT